MHPRRSAFTLIELLVVIAIIAILAVVVVLTLNPAELLRQSRDANRLSDLATMNSALGIFSTNTLTGSFGKASTTYVSIPDSLATSTLGNQCQGLVLPALASGDTYQCPASSTSRAINGTGWLPVNLSLISSGSPLDTLPQDPINTSSTGLYYTYTTNGSSNYEVTSLIESQKYKSQYGASPLDPLYPDILAKGSSLTLSELYNPNGLVGYWPLDEGTGSMANDASGNGNTGTWNGTQAGTSGYYSSPGKVGPYAGYFDGSTDYVNIATLSAFPAGNTARTVSLWLRRTADTGGGLYEVAGYGTNSDNSFFYIMMVGSSSYAGQAAHSIILDDLFSTTGWFATGFVISDNNWHYVVGETDGSSNTSVYVDGVLVANGSHTWNTVVSSAYIGKSSAGYPFPGLIDDVRIYNRALSAAEIQALYNAEK